MTTNAQGQTVVVPPTGAGVTSAPNGNGATTGGGAGSSPATPGGQGFAPGQFIDVIFTIPAADSEAAGRAEFRRQQLIAAGIPAAVLRTTDFPKLRLIPGSPPIDSYLVYVGPFTSQQEAQARCTAQPPLGTLCVPVQPNPAN